MNKTQRLRNTADGFMAALVACGFRGPWRFSNLDWELPFYRAWDRWEPARRDSTIFPRLRLGGFHETSEARELLWQLKRTSPFHGYRDELLPEEPLGLTPREYLEIWAKGATPDEWIQLAAMFLEELDRKRS